MRADVEIHGTIVEALWNGHYAIQKEGLLRMNVAIFRDLYLRLNRRQSSQMVVVLFSCIVQLCATVENLDCIGYLCSIQRFPTDSCRGMTFFKDQVTCKTPEIA